MIEYFEKTHCGYDVTGPDADGDMCVEDDGNMIWLSEADVQAMQARFDAAKAKSCEFDENGYRIQKGEHNAMASD